MPIVKEQQVRSVQPAAQVRDFYTRPAINRNNRLEQIASAYRGFSTNLGTWLDQQRKKREDIEIAQGMELYRRRLQYGEEFNANEMQEKAKNGDYEGFKDLTRFQKEGIRRIRHEIFGAKLQEHMQTWAGNATITDANGNQIPLSMCEDTDAVIRAFYQESARYAQEKTGGQYDPRLAQEHIRSAERNAFNQFINNQAAARNEQIKLEQQAVATEMFDMTLKQLINDGSFLTDPDNGKQRFDTLITAMTGELISNGFTVADTREFITNYLYTLMRTTRDNDTIDRVLELANSHPLFLDPATRNNLAAAAEMGRKENYYRQSMQRAEEQEQTERTAWDNLMKFSRGEMSRDELQAYANSSYEAARAVAAMEEIRAKGINAATAMPFEQYDGLRIAAMRGQLTYSGLMSILPQLSDGQRDELLGYVNHYEQRIRRITDEQIAQGKIPSRYAANQVIQKDLQFVENAFERYLGAEFKQYDDIGYAPRINADKIKMEMIAEAYVNYDNWKTNNPELAANPFAANNELNRIINGIATNRMDNLMSYVANPQLYYENPQEVRYNDAKTNVDSRLNATKSDAQFDRLRDALKTKNTEVVANMLRKQGVDKGRLNGEVTRLIRDFEYVEEQVDKQRQQAQEGGGA